jgi:prefoldin beta subunit
MPKNSKSNEDNCSDEHEHHEHEQKQVSLDSLDEETKREIQELQALEQNMQQFLMQKQAFSMELDEVELCLGELKETSEEVFKIIGSKIIVKTTKEKMEKELAHKKELIGLRLKTMEKQEQEFLNRTESLREKIIKKISLHQ